MIARRALIAAGLALTAGRAFALDPGVVTGRYKDDDNDIVLTHAIALDVDNTEGLLDRPRELRVLLSDREIPIAALYGQAFPPVWFMATKGQVRGVLLAFDPADRSKLLMTLLAPPEPGYSLATTTISYEGLWSRLEVNPTRMAGELNPDAIEHLTARFSAPVFTNAVVADLKGPAAAASEPVQAVMARAQAIARGDMAAAAALSTASSAARLQDFPPETMALARKELPKLIARLKTVKRVVVRRETAVILLGPHEFVSVSREGGVWKAAD
jgi:hypothetical protein